MGLNIEKLSSKEFNEKLDKQIVEEKSLEIPEGLIQFSSNKILNYCLSKKTGLKDNPSPRVLINWVKNGIVEVKEEDKGKIKRFDKLESIWLSILVELRGFGMPIESIQRTRKILFEYLINDFALFKFQVLNSILRTQQTLVIYKNGDARIMPTEIYIHLLDKKRLLPHLSFKLADFIGLEYPKHSLHQKFEIKTPFENVEKMKLLFFLRTGEYQNIKVKLAEGDVRYIENTDMLLKSEEVLEAFSYWKFEEIIVSIDDETDTVITSKI